MRFLYVKLSGYIGLYNGLGVNDITIDFTKCKNKITVISGPNGVGKSTLLQALSILPDGNENFVPSMAAYKQIRLFDNDNIYDIMINHPIDKNLNRGTSKATISKNGVELNPNGNISSYKDIIFAEFDLDSNYMALSKLSGDNRGLADKKPAERRKFVATIYSSLDTYNAINKNLNKKANIFKSYINNLSSKIQNIGDENYLRTNLVSINNRYNSLVQIIEDCKSKLTEYRTIMNMSDPDGKMQEKYDTVESELNIINSNIRDTRLKIDKLLVLISDNGNKTNFEEFNIDNAEKAIDNCISVTDSQFNENKAKISALLSRSSQLSTEIDGLYVKLDNINSSIDLELDKQIELYSNKINSIESELNILGIKDINDISRDEIEYSLNIINKIIAKIDELYETEEKSDIDNIRSYIDINIEYLLNSKEELIKSKKEKIAQDQIQIVLLEKDQEVIQVLNDRPDTCYNDTCPFIKTSIDTLKKYESAKKLNHIIEKLYQGIDDDNKIIKVESDLINQINIISRAIKKYKDICNIIEDNKILLSKFSITQNILDPLSLLSLLEMENRFNELRNVNQCYQIANNITEYKSSKQILDKLLADKIVQNNKIEMRDDYHKSITDKEDEIKSISIQVESLQKNGLSISSILDHMKSKKEKIIQLRELMMNYNDLCSKKEYKQKEFESINNTFQSSIDTLTGISDMESAIRENKLLLDPLINQKKDIETQLTLLSSYQSEYGMYKEKYDMIDKLRKYSSPSGGIQSLFMSLYMDQTLDLANQLLGMMFGGQYTLLKYVINDSEFRLPFIGNGLTVDDISSGSTSQVCIMGMIINLVLRNQASTKYNITSLDEIDGGLDHNNRYLFVDILQKIIDILHIDQLFIISHSVESALSNVDVIQLSNSPDYNDLFSNANVIYKYGED